MAKAKKLKQNSEMMVKMLRQLREDKEEDFFILVRVAPKTLFVEGAVDLAGESIDLTPYFGEPGRKIIVNPKNEDKPSYLG